MHLADLALLLKQQKSMFVRDFIPTLSTSQYQMERFSQSTDFYVFLFILENGEIECGAVVLWYCCVYQLIGGCQVVTASINQVYIYMSKSP